MFGFCVGGVDYRPTARSAVDELWYTGRGQSDAGLGPDDGLLLTNWSRPHGIAIVGHWPDRRFDSVVKKDAGLGDGG